LQPHLGVLAASAAVSNTDAHVSMFGLLARLLISLFIVLMVLWVLAQIVRKRGMRGRGGGSRARRHPDVLARQSLGKGQTLVTVRLDDRVLVLGVTPQNISNLTELDPSVYGITPGGPEVLELEEVSGDDTPALSDASGSSAPTPASSVFSWNERLDRLRERTVRQ
jgi:flagellar protein FliO/FliZ